MQAVSDSQTTLTHVQSNTLPVIVRSDQPPAQLETLEIGLSQHMKVPVVQEKAIGDLNALDWTWFALGFLLGAFITIATTGMISAFGTCLQMWAYIVASLYSFYVYMVGYEESKFDDQSYLMGMVLSALQFF